MEATLTRAKSTALELRSLSLNQRSGANLKIFFLPFLAFSDFTHKMLRKHIWPTFGVHSTQTLVEIYNKYQSVLTFYV